MLRHIIKIFRADNWARGAGLAAVFLSVIVCCFLYAISYPPFPSRFPITQDNNRDPYIERQTSSGSQRNSTSIPPAITLIPAPKGETETERDENERFKKAANERGLTIATWVLSFATFLLFSAVAVQAYLFIWQLRLIEKSLIDTKKAADAATKGAEAARLNAQAVIDTEHARLFVKIEQHNLDDITNAAQMPPEQSAYALPTLKVGYAFRNHGRTPAIIKEVGHRILTQVAPLPQILEDRNYVRVIPLPIDHIIDGGDPSGPSPIVCRLDGCTVAVAKEITNADNTLWFFGYVSYDDTFGWGRELHFIWHWSGTGGLRLYSYREIKSETRH